MKTYQLLVSHILHDFCNFEWLESIHLRIRKRNKTSLEFIFIQIGLSMFNILGQSGPGHKEHCESGLKPQGGGGSIPKTRGLGQG